MKLRAAQKRPIKTASPFFSFIVLPSRANYSQRVADAAHRHDFESNVTMPAAHALAGSAEALVRSAPKVPTRERYQALRLDEPT